MGKLKSSLIILLIGLLNILQNSGKITAQTMLYTNNVSNTSAKLNWSYDLEPSQGIYYGAYVPVEQGNSFVNDAGKGLAIVHKYTAWGSAYNYFDYNTMNSIRWGGSIPLITWEPWNYNIYDSKYALINIINGHFDSYIWEWATAAKSWGHPFFIRFGHEMNGKPWYPWQIGVNGNTSDQYIKAYRKVVDIFRAAGANNVSWVWNPNVSYPGSTSLWELYPGDSYVHWVGLNGYNLAYNSYEWKSFSTIYNQSLNELSQIAPSKKIMIGEISSSETGGSKSGWIWDALKTQIPNQGRIKAMVWFNHIDRYDFRIQSSYASKIAFHDAIQNGVYLNNRFGNIGASGYNVRYKSVNSSNWETKWSATFMLDIYGLASGTKYEYQVQSKRWDGSWSAYSASNYFTTSGTSSGGGTTVSGTGCSATPSGLNAIGLWENGSTLVWNQTGASNYKIKYKAVNAANYTYVNSAAAWINIKGLAPATKYEYQVKSECNNTGSNYAIGYFTTTGSGATSSSCTVPTGLNAIGLWMNGATLLWNKTGASNYKVKYREAGSSTFLYLQTTQDWINLTGLKPSVKYEFQIKSLCGTTQSSYAVGYFTTTATNVTSAREVITSTDCKPPSGLNATSVNSNSANLTWQSTGSKSYKIKYRPLNLGNFLYKGTTNNSIIINGLLPSTLYEFQVKSECGETISTYSTATFTTASQDIADRGENENMSVENVGEIPVDPDLETGEAVMGSPDSADGISTYGDFVTGGGATGSVADPVQAGIENDSVAPVQITKISYKAFPNPFIGEAKLKVTAPAEWKMKITIADSRGAIVYKSDKHFTNEEIPFGSNFAAGMYIIEVKVIGKRKVIKMIKAG